MAILSSETIRLGASAASKQEAIQQAGALLVASGCVAANYVDGMLKREQVISTYLGNGVAIPHGQHENMADVIRTGIAVVQFPAGVEWEPGELAYLVIGIAANADEHVGVLANLAEVIEDESIVQQLAQTSDPLQILEQLGRAREEEAYDEERHHAGA